MTSKNASPGEEKTETRGMPPRVAPSKPESSPNPSGAHSYRGHAA